MYLTQWGEIFVFMSSNRRDDNRVPNISGVRSDTFLGSVEPAVDPNTHEMLVKGTLTTSDIEIGAVELKNGTDDTRAKIGVVSGLATSDNGLPVAAYLLTGANVIGAVTQSGTWTVTASNVTGNIAHDAVDSGNPVKIGGKVSTATPTPVQAADRVDAWFNEYGQLVTSDYDIEVGSAIGSTGLRDRLMAQRYTVQADSLADGLAGFWTTTTANGGTATSSGGEGLIQTSANANGSAQLSSTSVTYFPGQVGWFNSAVRMGDTGVANNTRRIGVFTVSGTTPQDGFYYELSGTTLNAVIVKAGSATATASSSWSRVSDAPFTLDANYHSFEIRYTANTVWFYIDNVLRHKVSGTNTSITATLNFPITIQSINVGASAANRLIAVRNCGIGRFGDPSQPVIESGTSAIAAIGMGGGTPHDSVDSGNPLKIGGYAKATAPTAVNADGDRVNAWFDLNGRLQIGDGLGSVTVDAPVGTPVFVRLSDGTSAIGTLPVSIAATVTTSEAAPTTIFNGKKTVTTAGTRVTLAASTTVKSVTIKALAANTGTIYVGDTSVASTNGFALSAGESISLDIANLNTVNLDSSVNGEGVTYIAVN